MYLQKLIDSTVNRVADSYGLEVCILNIFYCYSNKFETKRTLDSERVIFRGIFRAKNRTSNDSFTLYGNSDHENYTFIGTDREVAEKFLKELFEIDLKFRNLLELFVKEVCNLNKVSFCKCKIIVDDSKIERVEFTVFGPTKISEINNHPFKFNFLENEIIQYYVSELLDSETRNKITDLLIKTLIYKHLYI